MTVVHKTTTKIEPYCYSVLGRGPLSKLSGFNVGFSGAKITVRYLEDRRVVEDVLTAREISW